MPGFLQFLASLGIAGARLELAVDQDLHPRGSDVTGRVTVTGGIAPQRIDILAVELIAFHTNSSHNPDRLAQFRVASDVLALPGSRHAYNFTVHIPDPAVLTDRGSGGQVRSGCRLKARGYIASAADPRSDLLLNVTIHREIDAVQKAMTLLGFNYHVALGAVQWKTPPPTQVVAHYSPGDVLRQQIENAHLTLEVNDRNVLGRLDLRLHETDLRERIRALLTNRWLSFPIEMPRRGLLTSEGQPNPDAALPRLRAILEETLVLPDNERNRLLRPSDAPDAETLLRPAAGQSTVRSEELLRSADEPPE